MIRLRFSAFSLSAAISRAVLAALVTCLAGAALACGDDDAADTPSSTQSEGRVDLASAEALITVHFAEPGDVQPGGIAIAAGDFNDDGKQDLLLGAPYADGPGNERADAGEAYVIFGRDTPGDVDLARDEAGLVVFGALAGDNLGQGVAAGDLNGDGVDDVVLGATASNSLKDIRTDMGEVYVIFGGSGLSGTRDILEGAQDFTLQPAEGFARLGWALAIADVNADGIADLIAGAPFGGREPNTPPGGQRTSVGEVYIVYGSAELRGTRTVAMDQEDTRFFGLGAFDRFGQSLAVADINGDDTLDIIVGAGGYDGGAEDGGAVFVFFGGDFARATGAAQADLRLTASVPFEGVGEELAVADANGDGRVDIIAGAPTASGEGGQPGAGRVYVVPLPPGKKEISIDATTATVLQATAGGQFVPAALLAADVTGDGVPDVVSGAPLSSAFARPAAGLVYVTTGPVSAGALLGSEEMTTIEGAAANEALGWALCVTDLDGDGSPELAIGAPVSGVNEAPGDSPGVVYVVSLAGQ